MATVQIADVYNPLTFSQAEQEAQVETNKFLMSGVLSMDPRLSAMAATGGNIGELPFYKPLGTAEPNYSTDNPAAIAKHGGVSVLETKDGKIWMTMLGGGLDIYLPETKIDKMFETTKKAWIPGLDFTENE